LFSAIYTFTENVCKHTQKIIIRSTS